MNTTPELVNKFEKIVDRVSQKKIFVVNKTPDTYYQILEYNTQEVMIDHVPTREIAGKICDKYNRQKIYTLTRRREIANLIEKIAIYRADLEFYDNVAHNAESKFSRTTALIRKTESRARATNFIQELGSII